MHALFSARRGAVGAVAAARRAKTGSGAPKAITAALPHDLWTRASTSGAPFYVTSDMARHHLYLSNGPPALLSLFLRARASTGPEAH